MNSINVVKDWSFYIWRRSTVTDGWCKDNTSQDHFRSLKNLVRVHAAPYNGDDILMSMHMRRWSFETKTSRTDQFWSCQRCFRSSYPTDLGLEMFSQSSAVLLPWASCCSEELANPLFSRIPNPASSDASNNEWVQRDRGKWTFSDMDQKSLGASPAFGNESWNGGRDPSDSPRKSTWLSPRIGRCRIKVDVLRSWAPSKSFDSSICDWKNEFSFCGKYHHFRIESFRVDFRSIVSNSSKSATNTSTLPNSHPRTERIRGTIQVSFQIWWILDWSFAVVGWSWNQWTKRNDRFLYMVAHFSFRPDCKQYSRGTFLLLCALLFQQSHQSLIGVV